MENETAFRQRFTEYLQQLTPGKVAGAGGLALLSASALLAYDPSAAPLAAWLGSLGLNVLAGVGQKHFEAVYNLPGADDKERVVQLARSLEPDIKRDAKLRVDAGRFLEKTSAFDIALAVVQGDTAVYGWLLTRIYSDVTAYRTDFDHVHMELAEIKRLVAALPADSTATWQQEALHAYLEMAARRSGHLPLGPLDPRGRDKVLVSLQDIFINVDAGLREIGREPDPEGEQLIFKHVSAALGHIYHNRQLILLGDPGSGKSTLLRHVAHCLAQAVRTTDDAWLEALHWQQLFTRGESPKLALEGHLPGALATGKTDDTSERRPAHWTADAPIPIFVLLRDFAQTDFDPHSPLALWNFVAQQLIDDDLPTALPALQHTARCGHVLFLLDGVDEVPLRRRPAVWQAIANLPSGPYGGNRWVTTCRALSFVPDEAPPGVPAQTLSSLTAAQIKTFIRSWYAILRDIGELNTSDAEAMTAHLHTAVQSENLLPLARNPMLLTVMALVQTYHGTLPQERAKLYQQCVETLLLRWQRHKEAQTTGELPTMLAQLETTQANLERLLWEIAWEAHNKGLDQQEPADITEDELIQIARRYLGHSYARADQFVKYTEERAHLLIGRGGIAARRFAFPHRTFQEYLAACYLAAQRRYPRQAAELAAEGATWREVLSLATGALMFNQNNLEKALDGVQGVLPATTPAAADIPGWQRTWLAGEMAAVIGAQAAQQDEVGQELLPHLRRQLVALLEGGRLTPLQRAAAGDALSQLGDSRPQVVDVDAMHFFLVPRGLFFMGSATDDPQADDDEKPQHELDLPYDFWIGRYPVTNAQFRAFVADDGYADADFWPEAQVEGLWQDGEIRKLSYSYRDEKYREVTAGETTDFGVPFNFASHPVVGVCWYEALAFTRWLTRRWRAQSWLPDDWQVRLPSEAEWEKAARGGVQIPHQPRISTVDQLTAANALELAANPLTKRRHPWGDAPLDSDHANYKAARIEATSSVGAFAAGRSPLGCEELIGNVWEWTHSLWGEAEVVEDKINWKTLFTYPYVPGNGRETLDKGIMWPRVLRGGSWVNSTENWLRCASRLWDYPNLDLNHNGFRVVVSPF